MRVLLFVEREGRGPKCVATVKRHECMAAYARYLSEVCDAGPTPSTPRWMRSMMGTSRWWLVQAADADAGRATIAAHRARLVGAVTGTAFKDGDIFRPLGRVLASGGKA